MASSDAKPFPIKNQAYRVYFPLLDADGDLVEGMAGLDSEVSKDGATFANCTNEATEILTIVHDVNDTTNAVTSSDATNQTTLNTLLNEIKTDYNAHRISTTFHDAADSTNTVTSADATDAATSVTLANEIKTDYNAHRSQADVHPHDDSANAVSSADATDEATCITLANEIKTDYNAHLTATAGSGMAYLDLTSTEMNADATAIVVKSSTTGAKTTPIVLYPVEDTDIPVNVSAIGGVVQSLTDFKDFVDNGYDPGSNWVYANVTALDGSGAALDDLADFATDGYNTTTNKIAGVELVDTTTTNTDMVGTNNAALASGVDLTKIHGVALTETIDGYLATAFTKLFDVATPLLVASDVMRGTDSAALAATALTDTTWTDARAGYLDELAAANLPTDIADIPTVSEFNARTLASADYVITSDTITGVTTVTNLTNAPTSGDLTATMKASVNTEVDTALSDIKLDHLINIAVDTDWGTTVHLDSVIGHMADVGTAATFDRTQESMEAIRARGDAAWTTGAGGSDRLLMVDTTIATLASQTSFTLIAGSADDDAYNNCTIVIEDASTATQKAVGIISDYTGASKTVTLKYDPAIFTMAQTDKVYILAENALKATLANRQLNVAADGDIAGNIDGSVGSVVGHTAQTGDSYAIVNNASYGNAKLVRSTTPANALDVSATGEAGLDFANIKNATGAHTLTNITVPTVSTLTNKSGFALSAAGADLILKDSTFALAIADAIWDEILSGATHNIASSAGRRLREIGAYAIHSGTAQAGSSNNITLAATASAIDGTYNRNLIVLVDNTGVGQTRTIVDYDGATKIAIIDRDWRTSPDATTTYQVTPDNTPLVVDQGVAQAGSATTITLRAYASAVNDTYLCNVVAIIAGTGRGQARLVGGYVGATKVVTICGDNWVTNPDNTSVYVLMPYGTTCTSCIGTYALGLINTECDTALTDYDPPTRTEATTDKDAIITEVDANETKIDALQVDSTAIKAKTDNLPSGMAKNVAVPKFDIFIVLSSDHVTGATGKTVTGTISKDGGSFAALTNAITEVGNGVYTIADGLTQAERNADVSTLKFTADDCDTRIITIISS